MKLGMRDERPLAIDLFCGLSGWGQGFALEGYRVVGFDIADMCADFGRMRTEGIQLVIQDVLTIHGSQFRDAAVIVASPPCQNYSYLAMPWSRSKDPNNSKKAKALRLKWETEGPDNRLFDACFRIQREAIEATRCSWCDGVGRRCVHESQLTEVWADCSHCNGTGGARYIPLIIENVRGAQPWVGRAAWSFGSFYLWGDVPALMPITLKRGRKVPWFANPAGTKIGGDWFSDPNSTCRKHGSHSNARKQASAIIAKIPLALSQHIAATYFPRSLRKDGAQPAAAGKA